MNVENQHSRQGNTRQMTYSFVGVEAAAHRQRITHTSRLALLLPSATGQTVSMRAAKQKAHEYRQSLLRQYHFFDNSMLQINSST